MPNIIEVAGSNLVGGASAAGLGAISSGVASAINYGGAKFFYAEETITLATGSATTDSTQYLLPANSIIFPVEYYITTALVSDGTSLTALQFGDASTANRFGAQSASANAIAAGVSGVGSTHWTTGIASATTGVYQASAAALRCTITGSSPSLSAGAVKVVVYGIQFTAPAGA